MTRRKAFIECCFWCHKYIDVFFYFMSKKIEFIPNRIDIQLICHYLAEIFYVKRFKSLLVIWSTTSVSAWGLSCEVGLMKAEVTSVTLLLACESQIFLIKFKKFLLSFSESLWLRWSLLLLKLFWDWYFYVPRKITFPCCFFVRHLRNLFVYLHCFIIIGRCIVLC